MKTILTLTLLELLVVFQAISQSPGPTGSTNAPAPARPTATSESGITSLVPTAVPGEIREVARFQNETMSRILGLELNVYGSIPQAVRSRSLLQLVNPFAPLEYGDGSQNTSFDPETRRANGYTLIGVKF